MKRISPSDSTAQAIDFINENIDKGMWRKGDRLPPVRRLAILASVSSTTMFRAINILKEKGLIAAKDRSGLQSLVRMRRPDSIRNGEASWKHKKSLLEKEIFSGVFGLQGRLPLIKELQSRYGVCYTTMKKILQSLEIDGVVCPHGKGYALPATAFHSHRQRIVFITCMGIQSSALNKEHNQIVNVFENECMRLGLHLEIVEVDFYDSTSSRAAIAKLIGGSQTIGFILDLWWYETESFRHAYLDTLGRLASFKKPVAILDELAGFELPLQFIANPLLQVFRIETERAGERVARLLLGSGHRSVAYITFNDAPWSQARFRGIRSQFMRTGCSESAIRLVTGGNFEVIFPCVLTAAGLEDDVVRRIIAAYSSPSQSTSLEKTWMDYKNTNRPPYPGYPRLTPLLMKNLTFLSMLAHQEVDERFFNKTVNGALDPVGKDIFEISLRPLFEKALSSSESTAWICANDATAFVALAFLQARNIKVPDDISVVGFDNTPVDALQQRLTSFDFNALGFINRMLNFIFRPPKPRGPYRHATIEVEGMIIERGSTGRVRSTMNLQPK
jgi:DNA-binding GntR family transcriptional regulator